MAADQEWDVLIMAVACLLPVVLEDVLWAVEVWAA